MKKLIEFFLTNAKAVILLFTGFALLGMSSYFSLKNDLFPDTNQTFITITTAYQGAAPSEVESLITRRIEDAVAGIKYIDEMTSTSSEGLSVVNIQFKLEANSRESLQDVKDRIDIIKKDLPLQVGTPVVPVIIALDPTDAPIVIYTIDGPNAVAVSDYLDDVIKPTLESIDGVSQVNMIGNKEHEIRVYVDPVKLANYQLNINTIAQTLRNENINMPGGRFTTTDKEYSLRILGQGKTTQEIGNILVPLPYQGVSIPLRSIATITSDYKEQRQMSYLNGKEAVAFSVVRQPDANISDVAKRVDKKLKELKLPKDFDLKLANSQANFINSAKKATEDALWIGAILATIVVLLFSKSFRAMIIAGIAMPLSVVGTYFIMLKLGITLNMLSLLALALIVGILVDDAIVALENALRHKEMYGEDNATSALNGTAEIVWAMLATTLTIIAVFGSIAFMEGFAGRFFYSFGMTVVSAVTISYLVAMTLTPIMCKYMLPTGENRLIPNFHILEKIRDLYVRVLKITLKFPFITVLITFIIVIVSIKTLGPLVPKGFMTPVDRGEVNIALEMDAGTNLATLRTKTIEVENLVKQNKEVISIFTTVGVRDGSVNKANLGVTFTDKSKRKVSTEQLKGILRKELSSIKDVKFRVEDAGGANPSANAQNTPIAIDVAGADLEKLKVISDDVMLKLHGVKGLVDIDSSYGTGKPEYRIIIDKKNAAELGVNTSAIVQTLILSTIGDKVADYSWSDDKQIDVRLMVNPDKVDLNELLNTPVQNQNKSNVPLSAVVKIVKDTGPNAINRKDRHRRVLVYSNIDNTKISLGQAQQDVKKVIDEVRKQLPEGYAIKLVGQTERMNDFFKSFGMAFVTAIILIYIVLAIQYNSFMHPITVMVSLPLALSGAFAALAITHTVMGIAALIGFVLLIGLVNKNAILLVDFALQREKLGMSTVDAMIESVKLRIRPVLMTTTAMIGGMMPIAMGIGSGSEFRYPMGIVVIGGLISSTIFTLIIVPTIFVLFDNMRHTVERVLKGDPDALPDKQIKLPNGKIINIKTRLITFILLLFGGAYTFISIVLTIVNTAFGGLTKISPFLAGLTVAVPMVILMMSWVIFLRIKVLMQPNLVKILPKHVLPIFMGSMALIAYIAVTIILSLWGYFHGTNLGILRLIMAVIMPILMMSSAIVLTKQLIHPHLNEQK